MKLTEKLAACEAMVGRRDREIKRLNHTIDALKQIIAEGGPNRVVSDAESLKEAIKTSADVFVDNATLRQDWKNKIDKFFEMYLARIGALGVK